jgi:hypothetical protein
MKLGALQARAGRRSIGSTVYLYLADDWPAGDRKFTQAGLLTQPVRQGRTAAGPPPPAHTLVNNGDLPQKPHRELGRIARRRAAERKTARHEPG